MFDMRLGKKMPTWETVNNNKGINENKSLLRSFKEKFKNVDVFKKKEFS